MLGRVFPPRLRLRLALAGLPVDGRRRGRRRRDGLGLQRRGSVVGHLLGRDNDRRLRDGLLDGRQPRRRVQAQPVQDRAVAGGEHGSVGGAHPGREHAQDALGRGDRRGREIEPQGRERPTVAEHRHGSLRIDLRGERLTPTPVAVVLARRTGPDGRPTRSDLHDGDEVELARALVGGKPEVFETGRGGAPDLAVARALGGTAAGTGGTDRSRLLEARHRGGDRGRDFRLELCFGHRQHLVAHGILPFGGITTALLIPCSTKVRTPRQDLFSPHPLSFRPAACQPVDKGENAMG